MSVEVLQVSVRAEGQKKIIENLAGEQVREIEVTKGADYVVAAAKRRKLLDRVTSLCEQAGAAEQYDDVLAAAHSLLANLDQDEVSTNAVDTDSALDSFWTQLEAAPEDKEVPIPTPWLELNEKLNGGIRRKRSLIIGGRPGEGKSVAAMNIAGYAAEHGYKVAIFSAEMDAAEVMNRIMAAGAQADYGQITRSEVDAENTAKLKAYEQRLRGKVIEIYDEPNMSLSYIQQQCRLMKRTKGLDLVIIDYMQMIVPDDKLLPREQQVGNISTAIKFLGRELDCATVTPVQLNRGFSEGGKPDKSARPTLRDLRESGRIEQDCDIAILLHHPNNSDTIEFCIGKNRTGSKGVVSRTWAPHLAMIR